MPNSNDVDLFPSPVHLIDHNVVPDYESPQIRIDTFREAPAQQWMFGQSLDAIK